MIENVDFLKKVLSIPTKSFKEDLMIEFLVEYLTEKKHNFKVDDFGNVYVTKGEINEGEFNFRQTASGREDYAQKSQYLDQQQIIHNQLPAFIGPEMVDESADVIFLQLPKVNPEEQLLGENNYPKQGD